MTEYKAIKLMNNWNEYCFPKKSCFVDALIIWWWWSGWPAYSTCGWWWGWWWWVWQLIKEWVYDDTFTITVWAWWAATTQTWCTIFWNPWCPSCIVACDNSTEWVVCGWWPWGWDPLWSWNASISSWCMSWGSWWWAVFPSTTSYFKIGGMNRWCWCWHNWWTTSITSSSSVYACNWGGGGWAWQQWRPNSCCAWASMWKWWCWLCLTWDFWGWLLSSVGAWWWGGWVGTCWCWGYCGWGIWWKAAPWCNATYVWGWGWGWGWASWCCYAWWAWCRWEVRIRYPKDWSYWFSCATWWTRTGITFNWKDYWLHSFTTVWTCTFTICC